LTFSPAAADTILEYLSDMGTKPTDYDMIYTGDLGSVGSELLYQLCDEKGTNIRDNHKDCGNMIFDPEKQDVHAGGSGCGCSASVLCSHIIKELNQGKLKNILFCATGALMSPTSTQQGENIPTIAHIINIRCD
jgi:stage V sporulation protein AD